MAIQGVEQIKRAADGEPVDYEALAASCVAAGTAGFKDWGTFDADASYRIAHGKKRTGSLRGTDSKLIEDNIRACHFCVLFETTPCRYDFFR